MSSGVVVDGYTVGTLSDDLTVLGNDGTEGTASATYALFREVDGALH